ncbi:male-specific histamine-binding salivary protein-like [Dermacentor andersoni]|uniref:male-specific histamine-binding salivary protein-like n=1 Tax=Dermacentor andersoni TaxID=34620 RepID=UPI002415C765|nr:male-specific histamine-binding salivary protein-like [Dermacentor andersoni]
MQVALLFSLFCAAVATNESGALAEKKKPLWANETLLGSYQDAWKSIGQAENVTYVLAKATYENDTGSWGQQFKCLSVKETNKNEQAHTVLSVFTFKNASSGSGYYTVNETVEATYTHGYNQTRNAIHYKVEKPENLTDTLIFSDGKTCDVFYVPYQNDGCELWVEKSHASQIPDCCLFVFNVFCANGKTIYDKYNATECAPQGSS